MRFGTEAQYFLFDTLLAPVRWELLSAGIELNLFDYLQVSRTADEVAYRFRLIRKRTELLLNALVSIGLLNKCRNQYRLDDSYRPLLISGSNTSMCDLLHQLGRIKHFTGSEVLDLLGQDKRPWGDEASMTQPDFWPNAVEGLRSFHLAVRNPIVMDILLSLTHFPHASRMLDLGAGSERLALDIQSVRPDLQTVVFDLPEVVGAISGSVRDIPQVQVLAGDLNTDSLGQGYDLVWASMVLNYARDLPAFMSKVRCSMLPGGMFASFHERLNQERTLPEFHVVGRIRAELRAGSLSLGEGVVDQALHQAGFKDVRVQTMETPFGNMELVTGIA